MGLSNNITAVVNLIALLCSVPIIASGLWLATNPDNDCVLLFRWPLLLLGLLVLVISFLGFVGAYWYKEGLLGLYLCSMAILILLLLLLLVFAFVVTRPDGSVPVPGRGYQEYHLDGFSSWLRGHVTSDDYWPKISKCFGHSNLCGKLNSQYVGGALQFFMAHITPLQSGCCKPPTICGYQYMSPTTWVNPGNPTSDPDCMIWSNDQSQLCYNCNSCRAGLLGNLRKEWRKANVILIVTVVVLIFVYVIACSAFRNAQTEDLFRKYKEGWA